MSKRRQKLREALKRQDERLMRRIQRLDAQSARLSTARLILVGVGAVVTYLAYGLGGDAIGGGSLIAFLAAFVLIARRHGAIERSLGRLRTWRGLKQTHECRMNRTWDGLPGPTVPLPDFAHPFEADLNVTGERSLLRLLDTTTTPGGHDRLLQWLRTVDPAPDDVLRRQHLVRSLQPRTLFRDRLRLEAMLLPKGGKRSGERDLMKMVRHRQQGTARALGIVAAFAALNWLGVLLHVLGIAAWLWAYTLPIYAFVYLGYYRRISGLFDRAEDLYYALTRFTVLFQRIELHRFHDEALEDLLAPIQDESDSPSRVLRRAARVAAGAGTQKSEILTLVLNVLGPWDLFFADRLEYVKARLRDRLPGWLDALHELDALNALATFAWLHPDAVYPSMESASSAPVFHAQGLGHPLLRDEEKVRNDFTLSGEGEICLMTGSNMSGKSTFLRTVGINLVLAGTGAPVDAYVFKWRPQRLFTCLQVSDSVNDGISYFYAEVRRLRALLEEARRPHEHPLLCLIDEIFRGTNNRERLIGSRAYIRALAGLNATGIIATHDLELVTLEGDVPRLRNLHFREEVRDRRMVFDYRLREGPSPTTNALEIMKMEGLPVEH